MNIFSLFESKDVESIKLGLEVIRTLGLEKEFEDHFEITHQEYNNIFNGFIIPLMDIKIECLITKIIKLNLRIDDLDSYDKVKILIFMPKLYKYFDLNKINADYIYLILLEKPELIKFLPYKKLTVQKIITLLKIRPELMKYFQHKKLKIA